MFKLYLAVKQTKSRQTIGIFVTFDINIDFIITEVFAVSSLCNKDISVKTMFLTMLGDWT